MLRADIAAKICFKKTSTRIRDFHHFTVQQDAREVLCQSKQFRNRRGQKAQRAAEKAQASDAENAEPAAATETE